MKSYCNVCIYETLPFIKKELSRGEILFHEGDPISGIYRIETGFIKVLKYYDSGDEKIFDILGADDFLALLLVLQGKTEYIATAIALTDVTVRKISAIDTKTAYQNNPLFQSTCLNCAAGRANMFHNQLYQISATDVDDKILGVLLHLYHKFGTFDHEIHQLYLPINQTDLASIIGIRRETLSRRLKVMQENGIISLNQHVFEFHKL